MEVGIPVTADQSVSIVREYSYNESVNPNIVNEQRAETETKGGAGAGTDRILCCYLA